jgi:hypothetical protein
VHDRTEGYVLKNSKKALPHLFKLTTVLLFVALSVLSMSCSSTKVVQSWANPELVPPQRVMIFGVTQEEGLRRAYEDRLSQALTSEGFSAMPSYKVLSSEGEVEKDKLTEAVRKAGVDGVFITRLVRIAKRLDTVPVPAPVWGPPFGPWGGYYPYWPSYYYDSYRVVEREFAFIESNLYKADTSTLLMSIMTRTEDPSYSDRKVEEVVRLIVKEFRKNGLLGGVEGAISK